MTTIFYSTDENNDASQIIRAFKISKHVFRLEASDEDNNTAILILTRGELRQLATEINNFLTDDEQTTKYETQLFNKQGKEIDTIDLDNPPTVGATIPEILNGKITNVFYINHNTKRAQAIIDWET